MSTLSRRACRRMAFGLACANSDVGLVREANEDSFLIDEELSLVAVADGMGGHAGGALASSMALLALRDYLRASAPKGALAGHDATIRQARRDTAPATAHGGSDIGPLPAAHGLLSEAIAFANRQVHDHNLACDRPHGEGMGTTLTGFWQGDRDAALTLFHIGDTRLYCLSGGRLRALTADQTHYQRAVDAGESKNLPPPNLLLQALGPFANVCAEIRTHTAMPGDVYLLCSDGLHGSVPAARIEAALRAVKATTVARACEDLITLAKAHGSRDNITAVVVTWDEGLSVNGMSVPTPLTDRP